MRGNQFLIAMQQHQLFNLLRLIDRKSGSDSHSLLSGSLSLIGITGSEWSEEVDKRMGITLATSEISKETVNLLTNWSPNIES